MMAFKRTLNRRCLGAILCKSPRKISSAKERLPLDILRVRRNELKTLKIMTDETGAQQWA